jgi:hypothetical protein
LLTSLREKLIKIGAKVISHGRYVTFQLAEVAVSRQMFGSSPGCGRHLRRRDRKMGSDATNYDGRGAPR